MHKGKHIAMAVCFGWMMISMVVGCGGKSFEYHSGNEIPDGPGVLSGEDGEFTVYDSKAASKKTEQAADAKAGPREVESSAATGAAAAAAGQTDEAREYREFQQWKKDKAAFEEFQQWKQSEQGAEEYREFQQWQKWREYKKWQENQPPAN